MQPVQVGKISVSRVEEMLWTISPRFLFPDLTYQDFEKHRHWLVPHFSADDLKLRLSIHTFVVRTPHHTIVIDTCIGNDRRRDIPLWDHMHTDYLDRLRAAGVQPAEVDYVFCTHLHVDHVGWKTRLENGCWVPTFPNARYLFQRQEWDFWQHTAEENQAEVVRDSLLPIMDAGLAMMVPEQHVIVDGVQLEFTPGHTPGHCSVHLSSGGMEAVITGDMMHHPSQIAEPEWTSRACWNRELARQTRRAFVQR